MSFPVASRVPLVLLALFACCGEAAPSSQFLAMTPDHVSRARVVEQLHSLLGHGKSQARLSNVEGLLRSTFLAMPKKGLGGLDHRVARHALYRYFLVQHGWYVRGLALETTENHSSSSDTLRKSQMPNFVIDILEEQARGRGIDLKELAVLAATIEDLVHSEGVDMLLQAYSVHGIPTSDLVDDEQLDLLIRTFMTFVLAPEALTVQSRETILMLGKDGMSQVYPGWEDTLLWVNDVREAFFHQDRRSFHPFAASTGGRMTQFSNVAELATQLKAGFGRFSDLECKTVKNRLLDLEDVEREDGRVQLAKFYAPYLANVRFEFSESPDYLRHLGALDDHRSLGPSVIVPNIMYGQSNCVGVSGFHSVCCIDDCETLMSELERKVVGPAATPAVIAEVVASISSETVVAPRNLSAPLRQRLDAIAVRHGGSVRLHARLFAEWMHFAFPNECPYPSSMLTAERQMTQAEWQAANKREPMATLEEMTAALATAHRDKPTVESAEETHMPVWSEEDQDLLGDLEGPSCMTITAMFRVVAGLCVLLASASGIVSAGRAGQAGGKGGFRAWLRPSAAIDSASWGRHLV